MRERTGEDGLVGDRETPNVARVRLERLMVLLAREWLRERRPQILHRAPAVARIVKSAEPARPLVRLCLVRKNEILNARARFARLPHRKVRMGPARHACCRADRARGADRTAKKARRVAWPALERAS